MMTDGYPYVEINSQYFSLDQNPVRLAWYLFFKSRFLKFRRAFNRNRKLLALRRFILIYLGLTKGIAIVRFPFHGHLIIKVHGGYRVFNFSKKIVTKVIIAGSNSSKPVDEIAGVRMASQFGFAPRMRHWNIAEGWYEEELINGVVGYALLSSEAFALQKIFERKIGVCLEKMISAHPPRKTTVREVVNSCSQAWEYGRLSRMRLNGEVVDRIYQFVQLIVSKLFNSPNQLVYRALTHGDFSLRNMLSTKKRLVVVDWESIGHRSVLFDLYNFFLTELYYNRASRSLIFEIREAIWFLQRKLNSKNSDVAYHMLAFAEIYRWLYYIERICMLMQRGLNDKIFEVIIRSINIFTEYEKAVLSQQ